MRQQDHGRGEERDELQYVAAALGRLVDEEQDESDDGREDRETTDQLDDLSDEIGRSSCTGLLFFEVQWGRAAGRAAPLTQMLLQQESDDYCGQLSSNELRRVCGGLAADPVDDALPERVGADGAGHEVRGVEAERRVRVLQDRDGLLQQFAGGVLGVEAVVGADDAAELDAVVRPGVAREVRLQSVDLLGVAERADDLATTGDGAGAGLGAGGSRNAQTSPSSATVVPLGQKPS